MPRFAPQLTPGRIPPSTLTLVSAGEPPPGCMPGPTNFHPHPDFGRGVAARLHAGIPPTSTLTHVSAGESPPGCVPGSRRAPLMRRGSPLRPGAHHGAETTTQLFHHGDTETRRTTEYLDLAVHVAITIRQSDCRMRFLKRDQTRRRPPCLRVSVVKSCLCRPTY